MSDYISEEIREIEKEIDEYYKRNPLISLPYCQAVWHLLTYYEDLIEFLLYGDKKLTIHETAAIVDNLICDLKNPLYWLFKECPKEGRINTSTNNEILNDCINFSELAHNYLTFESAYIYGSLGIVTLSLVNQTIIPGGRLYEDNRYAAYNRLLQQLDIQIDYSSEEILKIIKTSLKINDNGFQYVITKRLLQKMMFALKQFQKDIFELPDNWNLGNYTLKEFRHMYKCLMAISFIHLFAKSLVAERGCDDLAYSESLLLISKRDLIWKLISATNVKEEVATNFIDDMTYGGMGIKYPDPALQPLINVEIDKYIIAPILILGSSAERNLITLFNRIPERRSLYLGLVQEKEDWLRRKIKESINLPEIRYFEGKIPDKKILPDIDLAIISDEEKIVFVTELKWFISPSEPREVIEKSKEIEKGINQSCLLEQEYRNNPAPFLRRLEVDDTYTLIFLVLSANNIGEAINQNPEIPVLKCEHFIRKLNSENNCQSILNWLNERDYLPIEGIDFEFFQDESQIGDWKVLWYRLKTLRCNEYL